MYVDIFFQNTYKYLYIFIRYNICMLNIKNKQGRKSAVYIYIAQSHNKLNINLCIARNRNRETSIKKISTKSIAIVL